MKIKRRKMARVKFLMWTDYPFDGYPNGCRVTHVKYDGNKYCDFILPDGSESSCKRGYLFPTLGDLRRAIKWREWWIKYA